MIGMAFPFRFTRNVARSYPVIRPTAKLMFCHPGKCILGLFPSHFGAMNHLEEYISVCSTPKENEKPSAVGRLQEEMFRQAIVARNEKGNKLQPDKMGKTYEI